MGLTSVLLVDGQRTGQLAVGCNFLLQGSNLLLGGSDRVGSGEEATWQLGLLIERYEGPASLAGSPPCLPLEPLQNASWAARRSA